jgi:ABC-type Fe3+/spermidine/putrescine transport system ATPase subunit
MRHEIRSLQQRIGLTAIHVTHDQEEAMTMADRIVILDQGRIAQAGAPEDVYRRPNSSFVASFLGADNMIEASASMDGGMLVVRMAGDVAARLPAPSQLDGPCIVQFRSSAVYLGRRDDAALTLRGRISQASYPGGHFRYEIETPSGTLFVDDATRAAAGDTVDVSIAADDLHVFPRPPAGSPTPQGDH